MTNHPIAEQDSLERLIARLRSSAKAYRGMLHDRHGNDCDEAADTLCQMRSALEKIANHDGVSYRFGDEVRAIANEALGTTPKIDKE